MVIWRYLFVLCSLSEGSSIKFLTARKAVDLIAAKANLPHPVGTLSRRVMGCY
jgi:hypothetical protein